jgi:hypothetical protein
VGFDGKGCSKSVGISPDVENSFCIGLNWVGVLILFIWWWRSFFSEKYFNYFKTGTWKKSKQWMISKLLSFVMFVKLSSISYLVAQLRSCFGGGGGLHVSGGAQSIQNRKICCEFFWTGFHSSDTNQCSRSLLWDLGNNCCCDYGVPQILSYGVWVVCCLVMYATLQIVCVYSQVLTLLMW